jgi:hypothetical protein
MRGTRVGRLFVDYQSFTYTTPIESFSSHVHISVNLLTLLSFGRPALFLLVSVYTNVHFIWIISVAQL